MKILMVQTRELCYKSGSFFLEGIAHQFRERGHEVELIDLSYDDSSFDELEDCTGKTYDAVIDINSKLPMLELDNGAFLLDEIGAPFYQFIIDHPLFHHPSLMIPIKNAHAIGIDKTHVSYMKKYYPHYKSVDYVTMPGTKADFPIDFSKKRHQILFTGTYESPQAQMNEIEKRPQPYKSMLKELIEIEDNMNLPHEAALSQIKDKYNEDFLYLMNKSYLVDKYRRNREREDILAAFSKEGVPITVMGEGWEKSKAYGMPNLEFNGPVNFNASFNIIANRSLLLDINPLFPCGVHDRVPTGFANNTVVVTNMNEAADSEIVDKKHAIFFDKFNMRESAQKIRYYFDRPKELEEIAHQAYALYERKYSWEKFGDFVERILKRG